MKAQKKLMKSRSSLPIQLKYLSEKCGIVFKDRKAKCPLHEDENPSLSYRFNEAGDVKYHCFAECFDEDIFGIIGRLRKCTFSEAYREFRDYFESETNSAAVRAASTPTITETRTKEVR